MEEVLNMNLEERFLLDMKALKILYHEISEEQAAGWKYLGNYICHYWDILLLMK